jgi:hypothetical protein
MYGSQWEIVRRPPISKRYLSHALTCHFLIVLEELSFSREVQRIFDLIFIGKEYDYSIV